MNQSTLTTCYAWLGFLSLLNPTHRGAFAENQATASIAPAPEVLYQQTVDNGFLFINGEFLPRPYQIVARFDGVTINRKAIRPRLQNESENVDHRRFGTQSRKLRRRRAIKLGEYLECGFIVISFSNQPLEVLSIPSQQRDFLRVILHADPASDAFASLLESRRSNAERQQWTAWLASHVLTEELRSLAEKQISAFNKVEARNIREVGATLRLNTLAYPFTVLGMVMGVFALGHLLRSAPPSNLKTKHGPIYRAAVRATVVSIGLIIVMSACDLIWTVLAAQAGRIRELNPLGSRLIGSPGALIFFKTTATLTSAGILFALRRHGLAQSATWWLCLVCLVLTFRWLMFNSMFMG